MKNLIKTLKLLENLNKTKNNVIYSEEEILEERENINEMNQLNIRLEKTLENLYLGSTDEEYMVKYLIELHLIFSDFEWHYDQMHEMIRKMIKLYR
ncbi:MAG: hypothetical protein JW924_08070 [Fusobacteriaceae bacterium]|nr:hypothetical protein [Fusobacteriaceae bacterium]